MNGQVWVAVVLQSIQHTPAKYKDDVINYGLTSFRRIKSSKKVKFLNALRTPIQVASGRLTSESLRLRATQLLLKKKYLMGGESLTALRLI